MREPQNPEGRRRGRQLEGSPDGHTGSFAIEGDDGRRLEMAAAWRELHGRLHGFVLRRVRHRADAEDIVQKVFLRMHERLATLRSRDSLAAWLYQTARNAIADHYRAPARRREVPVGDTRSLDHRGAPLASEEEADPGGRDCAAACLRPLIGRLPESRRAIERVELEGMSQRSAAEAEGLSLSGMKSGHPY